LSHRQPSHNTPEDGDGEEDDVRIGIAGSASRFSAAASSPFQPRFTNVGNRSMQNLKQSCTDLISQMASIDLSDTAEFTAEIYHVYAAKQLAAVECDIDLGSASISGHKRVNRNSTPLSSDCSSSSALDSGVGRSASSVLMPDEEMEVVDALVELGYNNQDDGLSGSAAGHPSSPTVDVLETMDLSSSV
jgi:hypothetical protein